MSEPITRADMRRLANLVSGFLSPIDGAALAGLIDGVISHAESASPPRVPGASAHPFGEGILSGPDQLMTDSAKTVVVQWRDARGEDGTVIWEDHLVGLITRALHAARRAGIEAAAQWHIAEAVEWDEEQGGEAREYAKQHRADAAAIRALASHTGGEQT